MKIISSRINNQKYISFAKTINPTATEKSDIDKKSIEQFEMPRNKDKFVQNAPQKSGGKTGALVLLTTTVGTLIPILAIRKSQIAKGELKELNAKALKSLDFKNKVKTIFKSFNIKYELKEMLTVSSTSIASGLAGGLIFDRNRKKSNKLAKVKESVFQLFNVGVPILVGDQAVKLANKKNWRGAWVQIAAPVLAIGAGMPVAAMISNTINNKLIDKENPKNRKIRIRDAFVHLDDFAGVLVLSKVPFADKLQSVLPFLYGMCGYEAGKKNA